MRTPLIDSETVAALEALAEEDDAADVVSELFCLFLADVPRRLAAIQAAAAAGDAPALRVAAHTLKGSAGNVGAVQVREVCLALERAAAGGEVDRPLVASLERLLGATETALRDIIAERAA